MSQQLLIVEMFIITLVTRVLYRRPYDPIPDADDVEETKTALTAKDIAWEEQTVVCEWDCVIYLGPVCWGGESNVNNDGH